MNIDAAISEPLVRLIAFHNAFNRNIKVSFGALEVISEHASAKGNGEAFALPTGGEPWGRETRWRNLETPLKDAACFLAEIGIARASAAFEDYLTGAKGEFDRAHLTAARQKSEGAPAMAGFDAILGVDPESIADLVRMATFFTAARNCIVHRSNRASEQLATLRNDPLLNETLSRWPRRVSKWAISLPVIEKGQVVDWRPRHAIMASDVHYRCASMFDRRLVTEMKDAGLANMAVHWCFFADPAAPCPAKHDGGIMIGSQLRDRYKVRDVSQAATIALLRSIGRWDEVRAEFNKHYPNGPETSLARRRRARRQAGCR